MGFEISPSVQFADSTDGDCRRFGMKASKTGKWKAQNLDTGSTFKCQKNAQKGSEDVNERMQETSIKASSSSDCRLRKIMPYTSKQEQSSRY